jgi:diadenosine tetraphosphate (Ap4A) HIT family hydrolase
MRKKLLIISVLLVTTLTIGAALTELLTTQPDHLINPVDYRCPFCNSKVIDQQTYYEGKYLRVLLNHHPMLEGHSMIVPKRHVVRLEDFSAEEMTELGETIRLVKTAFERLYDTSEYLLVVQNGVNAGQTVLHTHVHMIPRKNYNILTKLWIWYVLLARPLGIYSRMTQDELLDTQRLFQDAIASP